MRLYELSADVLHWLGVTRVHKLVTSNELKVSSTLRPPSTLHPPPSTLRPPPSALRPPPFKVRVLREAGIEVLETVAIPDLLLKQMTGEGATIESTARATSIDDPKRSPRLGPVRTTRRGAAGKPQPTIAKGGKCGKDGFCLDGATGGGGGARATKPNGAHQALTRVVLTTHTGQYSATPLPVVWGHADPSVRGAIVATLDRPDHRNAIGTHNGPYAVYRAVGVARGQIAAAEARRAAHPAARPSRQCMCMHACTHVVYICACIVAGARPLVDRAGHQDRPLPLMVRP